MLTQQLEVPTKEFPAAAKRLTDLSFRPAVTIKKTVQKTTSRTQKDNINQYHTIRVSEEAYTWGAPSFRSSLRSKVAAKLWQVSCIRATWH